MWFCHSLVVVPGGKVADVQRGAGETRDLRCLPFRKEPIRDSTLIEDLDGACVQTACARAGKVLAGAPLDNGDVHAGQRQLSRQHQPRRTSSGDHHRMLGHRHTPVGITPVATRASHPSAAAATVPNCAATNRPRAGARPADGGVSPVPSGRTGWPTGIATGCRRLRPRGSITAPCSCAQGQCRSLESGEAGNASFLSQHPRQSKVRESAAVGEPCYGGYPVVLKREDEQCVRPSDVGLRTRQIAREGGLAVGARWHQP
jgi:hypothetical protein